MLSWPSCSPHGSPVGPPSSGMGSAIDKEGRVNAVVSPLPGCDDDALLDLDWSSAFPSPPDLFIPQEWVAGPSLSSAPGQAAEDERIDGDSVWPPAPATALPSSRFPPISSESAAEEEPVVQPCPSLSSAPTSVVASIFDCPSLSSSLALVPSAGSQPSSLSTSTSSLPSACVEAARPRFYSRKVACQVCHFAKARCDGGRPCSRCVRLNHTPHCVDRASRRGKGRQRGGRGDDGEEDKVKAAHVKEPVLEEAKEEEEPAEPPFKVIRLRSPSSVPRLLRLPFALFNSPMDLQLLSSSLLASHSRTFTRVQLMGAKAPRLRQVDLTDKLLNWACVRAMMQPADRMALAHSFILGQPRWYATLFEQRHQQVMEDAAAVFRSSSAAVRLHARRAMRPLHHGGGGGDDSEECDGSFCNGFCPFWDALVTTVPRCGQTWECSPTLPMSDQPGMPNQPLLLIRRASDEGRETRKVQEQAAADAAVQVAKHFLAVAEAAEPADSSRLRERPSSCSSFTSTSLTFHSPPCSPSTDLSDECVELSTSCSSILSLPAAMGPVLVQRCSVEANRGFEQLLDYSQAEVRDMFISHGEAAMYCLFRSDCWPQLMDWDKTVQWAMQRETRLYVTCLTRGGREVQCVLHQLNEFTASGAPTTSYISLLPLPSA